MGQIGTGVGHIDGRGTECAERPHSLGYIGRIFQRWQMDCLWLS